MNLRQETGQGLMIGIRGTFLDKVDRSHLREISPGGVILFSRNISGREQVKKLIADIKDVVQPPPLIAVDQEGVLVIRFFRDLTVMPGNMALGAIDNPELAFRQGTLVARELKEIGFDVNLAPVVDVVSTYDNPGITIRSFGANPERVAVLAAGFIRGTQEQGMTAVAKHYPGKGAASKDAHFELPVVNVPPDELRSTHLYPFEKAIREGVSGIMSSHVIYQNFDGNGISPATFSSFLIRDYLRKELGFQGVIFSDDMEMGAISRYFPFNEAVVNAAHAGHDMILICSDYEKERLAVSSLMDAYKDKRLSTNDLDESVEKIDRLRRFSQDPVSTEGGSEEDASRFAYEIAEKSMTLLSGQVPVPVRLSSNARIVAIIPDLSTLESVEEGLEPGENNFISRMLEEGLGIAIQREFVSVDPTEEEIKEVQANIDHADVVLAFIFNARFVKGQSLLLEKLKARPHRVIFILIRNPFDLEFLGEDYTVLVTYGYRKVQIEAAVKVLAGEITARGKLPFARRGW